MGRRKRGRRRRLILDTLPLYRLLRGDEFHAALIEALRGCGLRVAATEAVLVETLYFAEKDGLDLAVFAERLLGALDGGVEALRDQPLRETGLLQRLGYADTELLLAAMDAVLLLTGDEALALEAQRRGLNAYVADWLLSLEMGEAVRLLCPAAVPRRGRG